MKYRKPDVRTSIKACLFAFIGCQERKGRADVQRGHPGFSAEENKSCSNCLKGFPRTVWLLREQMGMITGSQMHLTSSLFLCTLLFNSATWNALDTERQQVKKQGLISGKHPSVQLFLVMHLSYQDFIQPCLEHSAQDHQDGCSQPGHSGSSSAISFMFET